MKRDKSFAYQKKILDPKIEEIRKNPKLLLRRYLLLDHFSGLYYIQYQLVSEPINLKSFLIQAWAKKNKHPLCGLPDMVCIPRPFWTPELEDFLYDYGVEEGEPQSGFKSGIRPLVDWNKLENQIGRNYYSLQDTRWLPAHRWNRDTERFEYRGRPPVGLADLCQLAEELSNEQGKIGDKTYWWRNKLRKGHPKLIPPGEA